MIDYATRTHWFAWLQLVFLLCYGVNGLSNSAASGVAAQSGESMEAAAGLAAYDPDIPQEVRQRWIRIRLAALAGETPELAQFSEHGESTNRLLTQLAKPKGAPKATAPEPAVFYTSEANSETDLRQYFDSFGAAQVKGIVSLLHAGGLPLQYGHD